MSTLTTLMALLTLAFCALPGLAQAATVIGDSTIAPSVDGDGAGSAEAFKMTAPAAGTVGTLNIYLDTSSKSTAVTLGLYADASGHPGTLLAQGKITAPKAAAWNTVSIAATPVVAGKAYWIAALGTGGALIFRDHCCGGGTPAEGSSQSTLTTLPATWTPGEKWSDGSASLYGGGTSDGTPPPPPPPPPPTAATTGQWGSVIDWPIVATHNILMKSGKTLALDGWTAPSPSGVYDPTLGGAPNGGFLRVDNPLGLDVFCSGVVTLADGRVLLVGGHGFTGTIGLDDTTVFNPDTDSWSVAAKMAYPRWYPTATELGDGRVVALSGNISSDTWADTPEVYDPATNKWTLLSGINTSQVHEIEYPLTFLLPNGKIFTVASSTAKSFLLDPTTPSWNAAGTTIGKNGSAVMYRPGKVLLTGGGTPLVSKQPAQKTAETIDLTGASPAWKTIDPMLAARYAHTLTVLPDGKVLAIGGGGNMDQADMANGELSSEEWDPDTGKWTKLASMDRPRLYHSTALLMPDGRVLVAGGGHAEGLTSASQYNAQYYSPPYLFNGARPSITGVPSTATYGSPIQVDTPDASSIASVSLVSLGADTHTIDMNQHFVPLSFTKNAGSLSVTLPSSPSVAPPGTYMLFIVNSNGVPSVAPFLKVSASSTPPSVSVTAPAAGQVSGSVPFTATASDTTGIASVQFTVDGVPVGPKLISAPYTYNWDSTGATNGPHTIGAIAFNGAGVKGNAATVAVTAANSGLLTPIIDRQGSVEGLNAKSVTGFTTTAADVLVALVTSDGPSGSGQQTATVSGAGLTWSLVKRVNVQSGDTEIWTAKANAPLTNATITSTQSKTGYNQSFTVLAFARASGIGASATANASTGAPTVSLTTTAGGSVVVGAGNDYDRAVSHTPAAGQTMVHQWLDTAIGDTYWVQKRTAPLGAALSTATISDSAPTNDRWNLASVEIVP